MPEKLDSLDRERFFQRLDSYLRYPGEAKDVEYKRAAHFRVKTDFSSELVRTILGMTNGGGGIIIIGFVEGESKQLVPDEMMSSEIAHTYESANISQAVEHYIADTDHVDFEVIPRPLNEKEYPIIVVHSFERNPVFCRRSYTSRKSKNTILEKGALYIREPGARTVKVAGPGEWQRLIEVCVKSRQQETLTQLRDLLSSMDIHPTPYPPAHLSILDELESEHRPNVEEAIGEL